jgi:hypothetical protein
MEAAGWMLALWLYVVGTYGIAALTMAPDPGRERLGAVIGAALWPVLFPYLIAKLKLKRG